MGQELWEGKNIGKRALRGKAHAQQITEYDMAPKPVGLQAPVGGGRQVDGVEDSLAEGANARVERGVHCGVHAQVVRGK